MSGVSFTFGDVLGNFAVSAHAFGASFGDESTGTDGSRATFAYDLSGNVGKTASTGQLQVKETDLDPQGATTDTCDTGAISWRLTSSRR